MNPSRPRLLRANRLMDLAAIDAVGFDLDHTLAIYDDAAVNDIAAAAARRLLVETLDYPRLLLDEGPAMEAPAAARTLAADLEHGAIVKLDAQRRVLRARLGGRWLDPVELGAGHERALAEDRGAAYTVYSPFELPVLWLLERLEVSHPAPRGGRAGRCEDIRRALDTAHTNGFLKDRLREDLPRFVGGVHGVAAGLERWASAGKRLFVVTNSEPDFARAVLDQAVGPAWRHVFRVVVADARKPQFFRTPVSVASRERESGAGVQLLEGGDAARVEALLGVPANRILFVGDNARSDIRAARAHGWRTAHVVPELDMDDSSRQEPWGAPLSHDGAPTWLAQLVREHADIACDHVGRLLEFDPSGTLEPDGAPRRESP